MNFLLIYDVFREEDQELFDICLSQSCRIEDKNHYGTILQNNFPRGIPCPYSNLNKNYLLRKSQGRHNFNRNAKG